MTEPLLCLPSALKTSFNESAWSNPYCARFNCYAYALNIPKAGRAHPGRLLSEISAGFPTTRFSMIRRLREDGLHEISEKEALGGSFHAIAAHINNDDFHFFRRDSNGLWSEKMGEKYPVQTAGYGRQAITNPRLAENPVYDIFCGYFAIPDEGILYLPRFEIPSPYHETMTTAFPK